MIILYYILTSYLAGVCLTAVRLGLHMVFVFDRFDWHYAKGDNWIIFILGTLLWPLMLIKQRRNLIDPSALFDGNFGMAARKREEARLWNNPPPCGAQILYRQDPCHETFGEFTFKSVDVENTLADKLRKHPHLENDDEGAILNWLRQRDNSITKPTAVPAAWGRFQYIVDDLLRNRSGDVRCLKCEKTIPMSQLSKKDFAIGGWSFRRLVCPNDHELLVVRGAHIHF